MFENLEKNCENTNIMILYINISILYFVYELKWGK